MLLHNPLLSTLVIVEAAEENASQRGRGIKFNGLESRSLYPVDISAGTGLRMVTLRVPWMQ